MSWWSPFQAIFFDLDGLLVNTEELHWKSYLEMCSYNGVEVPWDFTTYYTIASRSANGVVDRLEKEFPQLFEKKDWSVLYEEKRDILLQKFKAEKIPLMPGVERLLLSLKNIAIPIAGVTHSSYGLVEQLQTQHSCFEVIQTWFARESYHNPKPAPDGYRTACNFFKVESKKCVGFEDSLRGIESLLAADVQPILVQQYDQDTRNVCIQKGIRTLFQIDDVLK